MMAAEPLVEVEFTPEQKLAICERAEELLDGGNRWTTGAWLRIQPPRDGGKPTECFCLDGALAVAALDLGYIKRKRLWRDNDWLGKLNVGARVSVLDYIKRRWSKSPVEAIYDFNDRVEWPEVEGMLKGRIKNLRAQVARRKKKV
jgi:hypothetical protein